MLTIADKLKILETVVAFDPVDVVNNLPTMEIAAKRLRHNQAVFKHIPMFCLRHWVEEVVRVERDVDISNFGYNPTALPLVAAVPKTLALDTTLVLWDAFNQPNPACCSTDFAGLEDYGRMPDFTSLTATGTLSNLSHIEMVAERAGKVKLCDN